MLEYIVVGLGLAGISFCETLRKNGKSFVVINGKSQTASRVAGGIINPIILKRFTLSWKADEQLPIAMEFYKHLEKFLGVEVLVDRPVLRKFASVEEQNLWFEAADRKTLSPFLDTNLIPNTNSEVNATFGYGRVLHTATLNTKKMLGAYEHWLSTTHRLREEMFDHEVLQFNTGSVAYKGLEAKHIIFAEGYGLKNNPFFRYLPMQGSKGEYLTLESDRLQEENVLKSAMFVIPLGKHQYKVGATYNNHQKDNVPSEAAKNEIEAKVKQLLTGDYRIVDHEAGVRPTVKDRRPLVGRHPMHERLWVLNGFGSHGVLMGPWASQILFDRIENNNAIPQDMDSNRFESPLLG
ncbi:MAG: FAD-binding oxidoreductase [Maribacter sp.]